MIKQNGFSLIELVVFITVIAIAMTGVAVTISTLLNRSFIDEQISEALSIAQGRMELILGQRNLVGYTGIVDPCASSTSGICAQVLSGYTTSASITPTTINTDTQYSIVSVTVTGPVNTQVNLKSLISGY